MFDLGSSTTKYAEYRNLLSCSPLAKVSSNGLLTPAVKDEGAVGPLSQGLILDAICKK